MVATVYMAVGQHCWGRGATRAEARANASREGGPLRPSGRWAYYSAEVEDAASVYVDPMGQLHGPEWQHVGGPDPRVKR